MVRNELRTQKKLKEKGNHDCKEVLRRKLLTQSADPEKFNIDVLFQPKKQLDQFYEAFDQDTVFFSNSNPDLIEQKLVDSIKKDQI